MRWRSMTGYGRGSAASGGLSATVEMSSVNRKQLDISFSMPRYLLPHENLFRGWLRSGIQRGMVHVAVRVQLPPEWLKSCVAIQEDLAASWIARLRELAQQQGLPGDVTLDHLIRMPDIFEEGEPTIHENELLPVLESAFRDAVAELERTRLAEGSRLTRDLLPRLAKVAELRSHIAEKAHELPVIYRDRLRQRMQDLTDGWVEVDPERIAREAAVLAERCDIQEELVRLEGHLNAFQNAEAGPAKAIGRYLDFLGQEMLRELTTMISKASDASVAGWVTEAKAEVEKIREQIQNIE